MAKLIYSMLMSLDCYVEDADGAFAWGAPADEDVHAHVNELAASIGTFLYGRRMYETMVFWETADSLPPIQREWARLWRATDKIVYSRTLAEPSSARTRIERELDLDAVRRLKAESDRDIAIAGPELAAQAIGLVDEFQLIKSPIVVGGGKPFFPAGARLDLELIDEHRFSGGVVVFRYRPVGAARP